MPQKITLGHKQMVAEAYKEIETIPIQEAFALVGRDDTVLVDIRDIREIRREGRIPGAFPCNRGMLEFWMDPESPYHKPIFAEDKKFVFFCAGALRSALAARRPRAAYGLEAGRAYRRRLFEVEKRGRSLRDGRARRKEMSAAPRKNAV